MDMVLPKLIKIRQTFRDEYIENIEEVVRLELNGSGLSIKQGSRIALAVGSRGVANINRVVKATVDWLKEAGASPFIVPAMGSHGGATAEGQRQVLAGYGVTEESMGVPVRSSMEVVELPQGELCHRVFMDKIAYNSDGVILINRVKVHTDFHAPTESGLLKMCVIGLGKHRQALENHSFGVHGLRDLVPVAARHILGLGKVVLGIGLVENAYDRTMAIKAVLPGQMEQEEIKLLNLCRANMPSLPVDELDLLIVDEIGKDVSGAGMDPNITGRLLIRGEQEPARPRITNIVATDLTEVSHGNALGMGFADFITERFRKKIDTKSTYENVLTSTFLERGKMPIVAETDRAAVEYGLRTCGRRDLENVRVMRIKNTLHLSELYVSETVLQEIRGRSDISVAGQFEDICGGDGSLREF
jgi:hypothetical protein